MTRPFLGAYFSVTTLQMWLTIGRPPYPNDNNRGSCEDTDPLFNWAVKTAVDRKIARLDPKGKDLAATASRFRTGHGRGPGGHARHTSAR